MIEVATRDEEVQTEDLNAQADEYTSEKDISTFEIRGVVYQKLPMDNGRFGAAFVNNILFDVRDHDGNNIQMMGAVVVQWETPNMRAKLELRAQFSKFHDDEGHARPVSLVVKKVVTKDGKYTNFNVESMSFEGHTTKRAIDATLVGEDNIR